MRRNKPEPAAASRTVTTAGVTHLSDESLRELQARAYRATGLKRLWLDTLVRRDHTRRTTALRAQNAKAEGTGREVALLDDRGFLGPGGGRMSTVVPPVEYRATTVQVAGLYPWIVGAAAPILGTPLGRHLVTGAPVCFDPLNAHRAKALTAPSAFIVALNGFGKSTLLRRIALGDVAGGVCVLWPGDVKPDGRVLTEKVGGQVVEVGYGVGAINPLDPGPIGDALAALDESISTLESEAARQQRAVVRRQTEFALYARQLNLVAGLLEIVRHRPLEDFEQTLLASAIRLLYTPSAEGGGGFTRTNAAILSDLIDLIDTGHDELMSDAVADSAQEYRAQVKPLLRSLRALVKGRFGEVFNGRETVRLKTDMPSICLDMSSVPPGDDMMRAAVLLAGWSEAFGTIEAAHVLADANLGPHRRFHVLMDELWQVLRVGPMMVGRIDAVQRLQRVYGTAITAVTHSIAEMEEAGALGFVERSRARIIGPVPRAELDRLVKVMSFSEAEKDMLVSWSDAADLNTMVDQKNARLAAAGTPGMTRAAAPKTRASGTGHFLLKLGEGRRPGIPFAVWVSPSEAAAGIHDTDQRLNAANAEAHSAEAGSGAAV